MKLKNGQLPVQLSACIVMLGICHVSPAQDAITNNSMVRHPDAGQAPRTTEPRSKTVTATYITVRNVRPSMLAWWLDPEHHPKPIEFRHPDETAADTGVSNPYAPPKPGFSSRAGAATRKGQAFELPKGVDRIIAVDSQNILLVYGTEQGAREIASLIEFLDKPVQQVDVIVRFIEIDKDAIKDLGIDFNSSNGPFTARNNGLSTSTGTFTLGILRSGNIQTVEALVQQGKVRQLGLIQFITLNNLPGSASMRTTYPTVPDNTVPIQVDIETTITPTINADGTITVLMTPKLVWGERLATQHVQTVANIADGDTLALGGLRSTNNRDIVMFLTARKVPLPKTSCRN